MLSTNEVANNVIREELDRLKKLIIKHENKKYPDPPYSYSRVENNNSATVIKVVYNGNELTSDQLKIMSTNSVMVRKLNILAGVLNAMDFSENFLGRDSIQKISIVQHLLVMTNVLEEKTEAEIFVKEVKETDNVNDYIEQLADIIKKNTSENREDIIRKIRNAERYFVAENNKNRVLNFQSTIDGHHVIQRDIPLNNKLTDEQREEFLKIHLTDPANQPHWFNKLSNWEKDWLRMMVPEDRDDKKWLHFEGIFQSSAMQHIPGIKNARYHELYLDGQLLSKSFNTSTMVAYEMGKTKDTKENTQMTAQQVYGILKDMAEENSTQF
jgi:hypothetical protein